MRPGDADAVRPSKGGTGKEDSVFFKEGFAEGCAMEYSAGEDSDSAKVGFAKEDEEGSEKVGSAK